MRKAQSTTVKLDAGVSHRLVRSGTPLPLLRRRNPRSNDPATTPASVPSPPLPSGPASSSLAPASSVSERIRAPFLSKRQSLSLDQQLQAKAIGVEKRRKILEGLSAYDRTTLEGCALNADQMNLDGFVDVPLGLTLEDPEEEGSDIEIVEAFDIVRAGQTYTVILDEVKGASYVSRVTRPESSRTREGRLMRHAQAWASQWEVLANEYLQWKSTCGSPDVQSIPSPASDDPQALFLDVDVFSWHWRERARRIVNTGERHINQVLIRNGLLSPSPLHPKFCVTLLTLETYRCLRLRHPRLSIQSFVRGVCDTQGEVYTPYLYQQFSDVYDVYLCILRHIDTKVQAALQRNTPNWRLLHSCPPCQYKLEGEESLEYSQLISMDGGMSLKRFANAGKASSHLTFNSDYFLSRTEVNEFAGVVKTKAKKAETAKGKQKSNSNPATNGNSNPISSVPNSDLTTTAPPANPPPAALNPDPLPTAPDPNPLPPVPKSNPTSATSGDDGWIYKSGDISPGGLEEAVSVCVERWKANADDSKKGMFDCFEESGIFISVCRHGFILVSADMVASGELAKYPLSILSKLQEVFPDAKLIGYDIGCATKKTVQNSRIGHSLKATFVIPSMHGYAHNRPCQLGHHPNYVSGTGLEDFEGCERVFSHLNDVARTTRHASAYHRHQAIHLQMRQWDADKYLSLGNFLLNNYRQALKIVEDLGDYLGRMKALQSLTDSDLTGWLAEELAYLSGLTKESEETTLAVEYVQALDELCQAEETHERERQNISIPTTSDGDTGKRRVKASYKASLTKVSHWAAIVSELEGELDIAERWSPKSKEYLDAKKCIVERKYHKAVDHLEKLVVQRLFELQKGQSEGTGYKMRIHLAKHLNKRGQTIRTAIAAYNTAARSLIPPRPLVTFSSILDISFLGEFDLLRDSRFDIQSKPWAARSNRALMDQYFKFIHAKEEIRRLNIEVRRLHTWIEDENRLYQEVTAKVSRKDTPLSQEILRRGLYQSRVNSVVLSKLKAIEALPGFTGIRGAGVSIQGRPVVDDSESDASEEADDDVAMADVRNDVAVAGAQNDVAMADAQESGDQGVEGAIPGVPQTAGDGLMSLGAADEADAGSGASEGLVGANGKRGKVREVTHAMDEGEQAVGGGSGGGAKGGDGVDDDEGDDEDYEEAEGQLDRLDAALRRMAE